MKLIFGFPFINTSVFDNQMTAGLILHSGNGGDCLYAPYNLQFHAPYNLQFSHRVPLTNEKMPQCFWPFKKKHRGS